MTAKAPFAANGFWWWWDPERKGWFIGCAPSVGVPGWAATKPADVVHYATFRSNEAFSWLSTRKVCQRWQAHYASLPNQQESNVV